MEINFTESKLNLIIGPNEYISDWFLSLNTILPKYGINNLNRVAAFLAQTAHESGKYKFLQENLNYSDKGLLKTFPKYFNESNVMDYARKPEAIANRVYANRMGNGPEESGDGWLYCGRGLIQLTGKNNYTAFAKSIEFPVEELADYLMTFDGAVTSACWFWHKNNLNDFADTGDLVMMTKKINGGTIGLEDRVKHYNHAIEVLSHD
ncbi:glycoside hydrolase family 19 protein [bacterium]|nr:glycoside hydrolase family 19 protein [Candidatus Elulimicrobium humile]